MNFNLRPLLYINHLHILFVPSELDVADACLHLFPVHKLARKEIPDHHHLLNESFLSSIQSHNSAEWRTPFCGMAGVAWRVPFHEALRCAAVEFTLRSMVVPEEYINEYGWWFPPLFRYRFCTCALWPIKSGLASRPDPIRTNWLSLAYMQLGLFTERSSAWQHASAFR